MYVLIVVQPQENFLIIKQSALELLYNYVDQGLLAIRNSDLPEKLKRNTKIHRVHKNKKKLGRSIEERPKEIYQSPRFGDWECGSVGKVRA